MTDDVTPAREKPRMSPRRVALLTAPLAGAMIGISSYPGVVLNVFWPEEYGGDAAGFLVFGALVPLVLIAQVEFLTAILRKTGLCLTGAFHGLKASSWGDTFYVIALFGLALSGLVGILAALTGLLPGGFLHNAAEAARIAPFLAIMFPVSWQHASDVARPLPQEDKDEEVLEMEDWQRRVRPGRLYLAWLANLCLAGPLFVWLAMHVLALPAAPVFGTMVGASLGVVFGIGFWTPTAAGARLLAGALFLGDIAAAAVSLPAVWALKAHGLAEDDWLPALVLAIGFVIMAVLAVLAVKRVLQRTGTQSA